MNRAVFLDRDGTVNVEKNFLIRPEDFEFEQGVIRTLKYLFDKGFLLIIISNQSGIARGYFTEDDLKKLNDHINSEASRNGFRFAGFYHCPHHKDGVVDRYAVECGCRKPGTELIEKAAKDHNVDLSVSFMAGDKESDIEAGKKAGLTTVLVGTGFGKKTLDSYGGYDHFFLNLSGIINLINRE